jgi:hypothetical protein
MVEGHKQHVEQRGAIEQVREELLACVNTRWGQVAAQVDAAHQERSRALKELLVRVEKARKLADNALECCSGHSSMQVPGAS